MLLNETIVNLSNILSSIIVEIESSPYDLKIDRLWRHYTANRLENHVTDDNRFLVFNDSVLLRVNIFSNLNRASAGSS